MNEKCLKCGHVINCINGKLCNKLHVYVEHQHRQLCITDKTKDNEKDN